MHQIQRVHHNIKVLSDTCVDDQEEWRENE